MFVCRYPATSEKVQKSSGREKIIFTLQHKSQTDSAKILYNFQAPPRLGSQQDPCPVCQSPHSSRLSVALHAFTLVTLSPWERAQVKWFKNTAAMCNQPAGVGQATAITSSGGKVSCQDSLKCSHQRLGQCFATALNFADVEKLRSGDAQYFIGPFCRYHQGNGQMHVKKCVAFYQLYTITQCLQPHT